MKAKVIRIGAIIVISVTVVFGGWLSYKYFFGGEKPEIPLIDPNKAIATVGKGEIKESITASGIVALAEEYEVYAEGESNIVKEFFVEEGDTVTGGQLLVNYDVDDKKEEYESKIKELEINLQNEKMSLRSIALPLSDTEKKELENSIAQAEKTVYDSQVKIDNYEDSISKQKTIINNAKRDIDNAKRNIDNAKNDCEKASKTVDDNKELLDAGAITKEEYDNSVDERKKYSDTYDDAIQAYDDAVQAFNNAESELKNIEKDRESDEYTLKNAELNLSLAQSKLQKSSNPMSDEETQIKYKQQQNQIALTENSLSDYKRKLSELVYSTSSLVSGRVTEICIDEGTYTEENTVMLKIANFDQLIVEASIAEYDAPNLELGQKVIMTSDGIEGKVYTGKIIKINSSASAESTNMGSETVVPIEISVDNPDGVLKPGYNLDLEIVTVDKSEVLIVPTASVIRDSETKEYYVFVVGNDNKIKKTAIDVGIYGETSTEIIGGISEEQRVMATASEEMVDGMAVQEAVVFANAGASQNKKSDDEGKGESGMMFGGPGGGMGGGPGGMGGGLR